MGAKPRVLLDVDGVIADFNGLYLKIVEYLFGIKASAEMLTDWSGGKSLGLSAAQEAEVTKVLVGPGMAYMIEPYQGAVTAVRHLAEKAEVFFVTSPFLGSRTWATDRYEWLKQHFGALANNYVSTSEKQVVYGDVFVDDKPDNVKKWSKAWPSKVALLWDCPHNRLEPQIRALGWPDVFRFVSMAATTRTEMV